MQNKISFKIKFKVLPLENNSFKLQSKTIENAGTSSINVIRDSITIKIVIL